MQGKIVIGLVVKVNSRTINPTELRKVRSVTLKYMKLGKPCFVTKSTFRIPPPELDLLEQLYLE